MNIIDFIELNGDKDFSKLGFNEVDSLICAQLAYFNYSNVCTSFDDVVSSCDLNILETSILLSKKNCSNSENHKQLIKKVLESKRYYNMKFGYYLNLHDSSNNMQFSAVTFIFDNFIVISYMGTDDTILGWREDFRLSYSKSIASQIKGVNYFNYIASLYDLPIILTGHSKGGNIAIYVTCNCKEEYKDRIINCYSFDAPGFNKEFVESESYSKMQNKIQVYIPESSFIGLIMYIKDDYKIVSSNKLFMFQHNMYNWLVEDNHLVLKDKLSKKSIAFAETNRKWIESFTDKEREIFFNTIFTLLEDKENKSISDFKNNWKEEALRIIKSSKDISDENKKLMIEIAKNMFTNYLKMLFNTK